MEKTMNHDKAAIDAQVNKSMIEMMQQGAEAGLCADCLLRSLAVLTSVNIIARELAEMDEPVTVESVACFLETLGEKVWACWCWQRANPELCKS